MFHSSIKRENIYSKAADELSNLIYKLKISIPWLLDAVGAPLGLCSSHGTVGSHKMKVSAESEKVASLGVLCGFWCLP